MTLPTSAYFAFPGAGTLLGAIAGALEVVERHVVGIGYAGTSGGAMVAVARARGINAKDIGEHLYRLLPRKDLLDKGWPFDSRPGLFRGDKLEGFLREVLGAQTRLGDLRRPCRVTVWDSWTRQSAVICSQAHPDVLAWRAAMASSSIHFFFDLRRVREDNARLYGDGGLGLNVPHGIWDDKPETTIGVRFAHQSPGHDVQKLIAVGGGSTDEKRVRQVKTWAQMVPAVADTVAGSALGFWPSAKPSQLFRELVIECARDGLAFGIGLEEVYARRMSGVAAGERFVARGAA